MRIHTRPYITAISGEVTRHVVSLVGHTGNRTFYIETDVGYVSDPKDAPALVGAFLAKDAEGLGIALPSIPGVTAPGEWVNPSFGDKEGHRARYSLKTRTAEVEREVIGDAERLRG